MENLGLIFGNKRNLGMNNAIVKNKLTIVCVYVARVLLSSTICVFEAWGSDFLSMPAVSFGSFGSMNERKTVSSDFLSIPAVSLLQFVFLNFLQIKKLKLTHLQLAGYR